METTTTERPGGRSRSDMPELHWSEAIWSEKFKDREHPEYRITGIRTHPLWPGICKVLTYEIHNKALLVQNNLKHPDRDKWENEYRTELLEDTVDYYTEEEATWQATRRSDSMFYGLLDDEDRLPNERDEDEGFTEWERIRCQYIKPAWDYDSDETWIQKGDEDLIRELLWVEMIREYAPLMQTLEELLPPEVQEARKESGLIDDPDDLEDLY